jgi:lipopolysaccharide export LptBFGC system permease protein LptF
MSGHHFHVHGPHDHEMEHVAKHAGAHDEDTGHAGQLAVITAILATVGALFGYMAGATQANAGLYKNEAAIKQTLASDQWAYYQAKGNKQNLAEIALDIVPDARRTYYQDEIKRYKIEKNEIKTKAEEYEKESKEWSARSDEQIHMHHRWAQAMTALSVAIAIAAIALLTKRRWFEYVVYGLSGVGLVLGGLALAHI